MAPIYLLMVVFSLGEGALRFLVPIRLDQLGFSLTSVGLVTASFAAATLVSRLPVGLLYRPRGARAAIVVAGSLSSLAFFFVSKATELWQFVVLLMVDGIGWGVVTTLLLTVLLATRGGSMSSASAMGWYVGFQGIGHALATAVGGLIGDQVGVQSAFLVFAAVPLAASLLMGWKLPIDGAESFVVNRGRSGRLLGAFVLPAAVWAAAVAAMYLNVMSGLLNTFFPILALATGLSLAQAGSLSSIRSAVSAVSRFGSIALFQRIRPDRVRIPMLTASAASTALVASTASFWMLVPIFAVSGGARGLLRVGTGTEAMSSLEAGQEGPAAGLMSLGLDAGKVVGPLAGGVVADAAGIPVMFATLPVVLFGGFMVMELVARRRNGKREAT